MDPKDKDKDKIYWRHLRDWCKKWGVNDSWWVSANNKVYGPYVIEEVERRCQLLPQKKIWVLHSGHANTNEENWVEMHATPKEHDQTGNIDLSKFKITSKINLGSHSDYQKNPHH